MKGRLESQRAYSRLLAAGVSEQIFIYIDLSGER